MSPEQDLEAIFQVVKQVFFRLSFPEFEKCIKERLSLFLKSTQNFPRVQHDLVLFIGRRYLAENKFKLSMHYAAIAFNIAMKHSLDSLLTETLQAEILLIFLPETHLRIKAKLHEVRFKPSLFLQELEKLREFLIFCRISDHLNTIVTLYEIGEKIKEELGNPAAIENLSSCQDALVAGLTLKENLPLLNSLIRDYREELQNYRSTYLNSSSLSIREFQQQQTQKFISFFSSIIANTFLMLGPLPCSYELCAIGSLARGEPTLFSDLEWVLFIEKEDERPYFERWMLFLELQILSLGETPSKDISHYSCYSEKQGLLLA